MGIVNRHHPAHGAFLVAALILCSCRSAGPIVDEYLDRRSGATVTTAGAPVVFARTDARYSRSGRDYLYLGPVSVNRQGFREHYLWIGLGTTLDRGYLAPEKSAPRALHLVVGGEPMEFTLGPWDTVVAMTRTEPEYRTRVTLTSQWAARITLDQIARIATASIASAHVTDATGSQTYSSWEPGDWSRFLLQEGVAETAAKRD